MIYSCVYNSKVSKTHVGCLAGLGGAGTATAMETLATERLLLEIPTAEASLTTEEGPSLVVKLLLLPLLEVFVAETIWALPLLEEGLLKDEGASGQETCLTRGGAPRGLKVDKEGSLSFGGSGLLLLVTSDWLLGIKWADGFLVWFTDPFDDESIIVRVLWGISRGCFRWWCFKGTDIRDPVTCDFGGSGSAFVTSWLPEVTPETGIPVGIGGGIPRDDRADKTGCPLFVLLEDILLFPLTLENPVAVTWPDRSILRGLPSLVSASSSLGIEDDLTGTGIGFGLRFSIREE